MKAICAVEDCVKSAKGRGLCNIHYQRWRRHGDPLGVMPIGQTVEQRFAAKYVVADNGCWIWQAGFDFDGYGQFKAEGRTWKAYKWAYVQKHGPVPDGLVLDHIVCDNRACCNPDHVTPCTNTENIKRSSLWNGNQTHCKNGHEYTPENTVYRTRTNGRRYRGCKTCSREQSLAAYHRTRSAQQD